ncbi:MAG: bifunctional diaminohydroxyphosphoribosylaminopyrimidine deaminase/5-amino-6-(5-phosphoribosylamino)uracil reductase RibD [Planctomycetota bacterium]
MSSDRPDSDDALARRMLDRAARAGLRAIGDAEPNPLVGCVIMRDGGVIGIGHHKRFGGLHAERAAIADCRNRGHDPAGATLFCTLEPSSHVGRQPPCTDAIRDAQIRRVIYARSDPGEASGGGAEQLRAAGIESSLTAVSELATHLSDPFVHRVRTGRPWVIAKWAQTIDGRIATRTGASKWISGPLMRRRVHRMRSRVDGIMVGRGTVDADDPLLTVRDVARARRTPVRIVLDTHARSPEHARIFASSGDVRTVMLTGSESAMPPTGVNRIVVPRGPGGLDLASAVNAIGEDLGVATLLVEAGPRVLGSLIESDLIDEAFVHVAPMVLGDDAGLPAASGRVAPALTDAVRFRLVRAKTLAGDVELHYRRRVEA